MHFTCSFCWKFWNVLPQKYTCCKKSHFWKPNENNWSSVIEAYSMDLDYRIWRIIFEKGLKYLLSYPWFFKGEWKRLMYFFVWVLYKLQFKVNWKHTLWNLSLLVVTLLDLTMNFTGFVPIWNPILTSKENKWQKCVWKTSVTYFNFSHQ